MFLSLPSYVSVCALMMITCSWFCAALSHWGAGSMLRLGDQRIEVVGVLTAASAFPDGIETFTNMPKAVEPGNRTTRSLELVGALRPGVSVETAHRDLAGISAQVARENPGMDSTVSAGVRPLRERYVGSARSAFSVIAAAALLLLVIACANVASLQLARGSARAREIAVRTALGATRDRVLRLLLTESVILAVVGGAAGIAWRWPRREWSRCRYRHRSRRG